MTTERQERRVTPPKVAKLKKATRMLTLIALVAAGLVTTACQEGNLYTGVSSNGGWNGPSTGSIGGITGYPF